MMRIEREKRKRSVSLPSVCRKEVFPPESLLPPNQERDKRNNNKHDDHNAAPNRVTGKCEIRIALPTVLLSLIAFDHVGLLLKIEIANEDPRTWKNNSDYYTSIPKDVKFYFLATQDTEEVYGRRHQCHRRG